MTVQESDDCKKVIFLYFPCEAENQLIRKIAAHQYETYHVTESIEPYLPYLKENPKIILFADATNPPRNIRWEDQYGFIRDNLYDSGMKIATWVNAGGGYQPVHELSNIDLSGFSACRDHNSGNDAFTGHILKILSDHGARGRRTHVRQMHIEKTYSAFSIKIKKAIYTGTILDLSSIAFACIFSEPIILPPKTYIEDIQFKLNGQITSASGSIIMRREVSGRSVYVISIDHASNPEISGYIIDFIYRSNQKMFRTFRDYKIK